MQADTGLQTKAARRFRDNHCINQGCTIKLFMQKQHDSTKAQDQRLEEKNLKPQLPHQQPSQRDIFPPTSMCEERQRGGKGEEISWHGRFLWRKCGQNAKFGQKERNTWKDCKNSRSTKLRPSKLQLNVKQHCNSINVLRYRTLKYWDYAKPQKFKTSP